MKTVVNLGLFLLLFLYTLAVPEAAAGMPKAVEPKVPLPARLFPLAQIRLSDGLFKHAMELDQGYLLALPIERLLHNFYVEAGLPSAAKPLGGWEDPQCELRGHFVGHYLSACALMYSATGDKRFKVRGDSVVAGLYTCQEKIGSGYLSAFSLEFIDRVETQKAVWAPYYTLHKIVAGLLDMYVYTDNESAFAMAKKFADWIIVRNQRLSDEDMQKMLNIEHGGINESFANLYGLTGDKKFFDMSLRFNHRAVIDSAEQNRDTLTGLHANTQIPKFIGAARQYELGGDYGLKNAARFFWNTVTQERSYVIGGHSDGELFTDKHTLSRALGPNTTETCNTYNMLKLTSHLFAWQPNVEYVDYYERALYNHILASQNAQTGMMCYYVPLCSGSRKAYNDFDSSFWCCTGTGIENHARYGEMTYAHSGDSTLYVNLFIASHLDWPSLGLQVVQETHFPEQPFTRLRFSCDHPRRFKVCLRYPVWAKSGVSLLINGRRHRVVQKPGSWIVLDRVWSRDDQITFHLPLSLATESFRDNPHRLAFLAGPVVLCAQIDEKMPVPVIVSRTNTTRLAGAMLQGSSNPLRYFHRADWIKIAGEQKPPALTFEPFYAMHGDRRYAVYWDVLSAEQWRQKEQAYQKELEAKRRLDQQTIDRVIPGESTSEQAHHFAGEKSEAGDFGGRCYRETWDGGWCSYQLKILPGQVQDMYVQYWGNDAGRRHFDILVDDQIVASQRLNKEHPDQFFSVLYPLPAHLLLGKAAITVRFQAQPKNLAGGLYDLRILERANEYGF